MKSNKKFRNPLQLFLYVCLLIIASNGLAGGAEVDCLECHDDLKEKKVIHAALETGCESCHSAIDATDVPHEKTNSVDQGLSSEPPELCYECHDKEDMEGKVTHSPVEGGECTSCHNPHKSDNEKLLMSEPPALCYECHDEDDFKGKLTHAPVAVGKCVACHGPHASDNLALLLHKINKVCVKCHLEKDLTSGSHIISGFGNTVHPVKKKKDPKREGRTLSCSSCHNPHSSEWIKLFRYKANSLYDLCMHCHDK